MAAPIEKCGLCYSNIKGKNYRRMNSKTSITQFGGIFSHLAISCSGSICNVCVNKLNRICALNEDEKTRMQKIRNERDVLYSKLHELPGVKEKQQRKTLPGEQSNVQVTPHGTSIKSTKRHIELNSPTGATPKSKKSLFRTPQKANAPAKARTVSTQTTPMKEDAPYGKADKSTETTVTRKKFDVKVTVVYNNSERSKIVTDPVEQATIKAMMNSNGPDAVVKNLCNAYFEWLYDSSLKHSKYKIWLWRMLSYSLSILGFKESFEYKWNMSVNLKGGLSNNIPNDNAVELQVNTIKRELNTQGANKSYESAKQICMTTQVVDSIKQNLMRTTKTARSQRDRPQVDKQVDIISMVQYLRQGGVTQDLRWGSFAAFKDPLDLINSEELHSWINNQKKIAHMYM